jgi:predicted transcriptional regulator
VAPSNTIEIAAEIVSSFVSNNSLPRSELTAVIEAVHSAVQRLAAGADAAPVVVEAPTPAVSVRKSITPEYLICLDDGKRFKSLRRHLATLGMTPEQYRAKWDLPATYPMVAPNYAAQRSALAKTMGLGQLRDKPDAAATPSVETAETAAPDPVTPAPRKAAAKSKAAEDSLEVPVKRKPGRPRKTEA